MLNSLYYHRATDKLITANILFEWKCTTSKHNYFYESPSPTWTRETSTFFKRFKLLLLHPIWYTRYQLITKSGKRRILSLPPGTHQLRSFIPNYAHPRFHITPPKKMLLILTHKHLITFFFASFFYVMVV